MKRKFILLTLLLIVLCASLSSCTLTEKVPFLGKVWDRVTGIFGGDNGDPPPVTTAPTPSINEPTFTDMTEPYEEGAEYVLEAKLPEGATATYTLLDAKLFDENAEKLQPGALDGPLSASEAGIYMVTATVNYDNKTTELIATLSIKYPVSLENLNIIPTGEYADGAPVVPQIEGLPEQVKVAFKARGDEDGADIIVTECGAFPITAVCSIKEEYKYDSNGKEEYKYSDRYMIVGDGTVEVDFTVTQKKVTKAPVLEPLKVVYNGKAFTYDPEIPSYLTADYKFKKNGQAVAENALIDAGEYEVCATFTRADPNNPNYDFEFDEMTANAVLIIEPQPYDMSRFELFFDPGSGTYTGSALAYEAVAGNDVGLFDITYAYPIDMIDVGEYTVVAKLSSKDPNYAVPLGQDTLTTAFTVKPRTYPFEVPHMECDHPYTGISQEHEFITNLPNLPGGVKVDYVYMQNGKQVTPLVPGEYTVIATITAHNYTFSPATFTDTFTITPATPSFGEVEVVTEYTFTGKAIIPEIENLPAGISVKYSYMRDGKPVNAMLSVGEYTMSVEYYSLDGGWIGPMPTETVTVTVDPATITPSDEVTFPQSAVTVYDGAEKTFEPTVNNDALECIGYKYYRINIVDGNVSETVVEEMINAGTYRVEAIFTLKTANYEFGEDEKGVLIDTASETFTIEQAVKTPQNVIFEDAGGVWNGVPHTYLPSGYDNTDFEVSCVYLLLDENGEPKVDDQGNVIEYQDMTLEENPKSVLYRVIATFVAKDPNYKVDPAYETLESTYLLFELDESEDAQ